MPSSAHRSTPSDGNGWDCPAKRSALSGPTLARAGEYPGCQTATQPEVCPHVMAVARLLSCGSRLVDEIGSVLTTRCTLQRSQDAADYGEAGGVEAGFSALHAMVESTVRRRRRRGVRRAMDLGHLRDPLPEAPLDELRIAPRCGKRHPASRVLCRSRVRWLTPARFAIATHPASERWRNAPKSIAQLRSCLGPHVRGTPALQYRLNWSGPMRIARAIRLTEGTGGSDALVRASPQAHDPQVGPGEECLEVVAVLRRSQLGVGEPPRDPDSAAWAVARRERENSAKQARKRAAEAAERAKEAADPAAYEAHRRGYWTVAGTATSSATISARWARRSSAASRHGPTGWTRRRLVSVDPNAARSASPTSGKLPAFI